MEVVGKKDVLDLNLIGGVLFQEAIEGMLLADTDGNIKMINPSLKKMFGYKASELIGEKVEVLVPDVFKAIHTKHRKRFSKQPESRPMGRGLDIVGLRKDGSVFSVEISLSHVRIGDEMMIMALLSDATEKAEIIRELLKEKEHARNYLEMAGTIVVEVGVDEKVKVINEGGCKLFGLSKEEIEGQNWFELLSSGKAGQEDKKKSKEAPNCKVKSVKNYSGSVINRKGRKYYVIWNCTVLKDQEGKITGTLYSGKDVTKQKQAELKLKKLNTHLEQLVENRTQRLEEGQRIYKMVARNFPNGVITVLDRDLNFVFVEGKELHENGSRGEVLIGTSFINRMDQDIKEEIRKKLEMVFKGVNQSFELKFRGKIFMVYAVGLQNSHKRFNRILLVTQDITRLKKAEEEMKALLEKERELNEMKSRFVSMASHEFRTPLTTIMNSASLLSKLPVEDPEEKRPRQVHRIKASVRQLNNILNDILSLDKLEEGKVVLQKSKFDILELAEEIVEELSLLSGDKKQIKYKHLGSTNVFSDKVMIKVIINNLLSNAIKYTPEEGMIYLKTMIDDEGLHIKIKDEGIGIPLDEQKHLFERFFRAKNALNIEGTGLGLNIVKKYVEFAGGKIEFESEFRKGTIFNVKMPVLID